MKGKKQDLKKLFKKVQDQSKVPIIVSSLHKTLKIQKPLVFVIDPDTSFLYFTKVIQKKLQYMGIQLTPSIFYYSKGKQLQVSYTSMGQMFDRYRTEEGWLQIQIVSDNAL